MIRVIRFNGDNHVRLLDDSGGLLAIPDDQLWAVVDSLSKCMDQRGASIAPLEVACQEMAAVAATHAPGGLVEMIRRWQQTLLASIRPGGPYQVPLNAVNTIDRLLRTPGVSVDLTREELPPDDQRQMSGYVLGRLTVTVTEPVRP